MFRWCAYCQHFIGESPPLDRYDVTHGACESCEVTARAKGYSPPSSVLMAQKLFVAFCKPEVRRRLDLAYGLIDEALAMGIRMTEILIGVLQPALYDIGVQWEKGLMTPAEEHAFSEWSKHILSRLGRSAIQEGSVVLTTLSGNVHTLGIQFLDAYLHDHQIPCTLLLPPLADDALPAYCVEKGPRVCGISVSLPEDIPRAHRLADALRASTGGKTIAVLGGVAFRRAPHVTSTTPVFLMLEGFMTLVKRPA